MKKMKNRLKIFTLLLGVSLLLWNCNSDEENILEQQSINNNITIKQFKFEDLNFNNDLIETFNKLNSKKRKTNLYNKSDINISSDFSIDSTQIKQLTIGQTTSYTCLIKRPYSTPNYFENLVIQKDSSQIFEAYIIKYTPSSKVTFFDEHKSFNFEGERSISKLNISDLNLGNKYASRICYTIIETWCNYTYDHIAGPSCYLAEDDRLFSVSREECVGEDIEDADSPGNGTSYGGEGSTQTVYTSPTYTIYDPLEEAKFTSLVHVLQLNRTQYQWLYKDENFYTAISIYDFLADNIINGSYSNEAKIFANEAIDISIGLDNFEELIKSPNFDPLDNPWLNELREYAKRIYLLKDKIPTIIWQKMNESLDSSLSFVLTQIAFIFNPHVDILSDNDKNTAFTYVGEEGVGILLYEFANGLGDDVRSFNYGEHDIAKKFFSESVVNDIKNDFLNVLDLEVLTLEQFMAQGNPIDGNYLFSPDVTTAVDSFNKHKNANWVQFFIGGGSVKYTPSWDGWIDVELMNPTSRNSLLLHIGDSYDRDVYGKIPLSTIEQTYHIKIKIQ